MLSFDVPTVETIEKKYQNNVRKCSQEIFKVWLTTENGTKPKIWSNLLKRLKKVKELTNIVEMIEVDLKHL